MGQLKQWRDQQWVRIGTDGKIKGPCGTSKDKKEPRSLFAESKSTVSESGRTSHYR